MLLINKRVVENARLNRKSVVLINPPINNRIDRIISESNYLLKKLKENG